MEVERSESISGFDASEWDRVAGDDILGTHGWLRVVEQTTAAVGYLYLTVRHDGRLVGAAACQSLYDASIPTSLDRMLYGRFATPARRTGLGATPALMVGSRYGMSEPFLIDPALDPAGRERVAAKLVEGILAESRRAGATVIVRNATDATPAAALESAAFQSTPEMPSAYIDVRWPTFAGYRSQLKKVHFATEKAIRQESNRARQRELVIERITDASQITSEMHALLDSHHRRLNGVPLPFGASFLEQALTCLGEKAIVITVRNSTGLLGINFRLQHAGCTRSMVVGVDQDKGRDTATYFVLLNDSVQRAIESADRRVYFGRLLYDVKLRRGCSIAYSTMWIRGRSRLQRSLLRSFIGLRTKKIEKMIAPYRERSEANAAAMAGGRA